MKAAKPDFIALNYYRTLVASYLPTDEQHPLGTKERTLILIYTVILKSKKSTFKTSKYGVQIDPTGLRLVLNDYYRQYRLPLIITENGLGTPDHLTEDGKVHDDYRIAYLHDHIAACHAAISDGVELFGYCPWSVMDILSSHQGFKNATVLFTSIVKTMS